MHYGLRLTEGEGRGGGGGLNHKGKIHLQVRLYVPHCHVRMRVSGWWGVVHLLEGVAGKSLSWLV